MYKQLALKSNCKSSCQKYNCCPEPSVFRPEHDPALYCKFAVGSIIARTFDLNQEHSAPDLYCKFAVGSIIARAFDVNHEHCVPDLYCKFAVGSIIARAFDMNPTAK
jgi:ribonuclease HIII